MGQEYQQQDYESYQYQYQNAMGNPHQYANTMLGHNQYPNAMGVQNKMYQQFNMVRKHNHLIHISFIKKNI